MNRSPDGRWELMPTALGVEVVTVDGRCARARMERSIDALFSADGGSIAVKWPRASAEVPFRLFESLEDLDREARVIAVERSVETRFVSMGNGIFTMLSYRQLEPATQFDALPVWVISIPELDELERAAGPLFDLGGPRFEASFVERWRLRWWPRGGGEAEPETLREAVAAAAKSI